MRRAQRHFSTKKFHLVDGIIIQTANVVDERDNIRGFLDLTSSQVFSKEGWCVIALMKQKNVKICGFSRKELRAITVMQMRT